MEDNDNIYVRQDSLSIRQQQKVAVIGCGGIGSWIALYLGLAGVKRIDIYDSDIISESNLNRFPLGKDKIGINKAVAMTEHIQSLRDGVEVTPRGNFDPDLHGDKLRGYNWVVVTTDSLKSRRMVYEKVVAAGKAEGKWIGYIECGADGHHATVTFSPAEFATSEEDEPGYQTVPVHVCPCILVASLACYYVLLGRPGNPIALNKTVKTDWDGDCVQIKELLDDETLGTIPEIGDSLVDQSDVYEHEEESL